MIVSLNWLAALLGRELEAEDAAARLTMLGAAVEGIERLRPPLDDIVVGQVERVDKHPNADRLSLCRVNDGREVVDVVCGAPVVKQGAKYPYAAVGTVLPGGLELTARKIRGVVSHGMLCSAAELELGSDAAGIMELHTDAAPGTKLLDAMPLSDTRLDVEVTANRPDLLCHKGIARELGAHDGSPVKLPDISGARSDVAAPRRVSRAGTVGGTEVVIEDDEGCPRYMAAVLRGVRVGPSPAWLEARLRSIGQRPINNVVDATNYVLFEVNQPMHAFDLARLRGNAIIVRRAVAGERLVTLDGEKRDLTTAMTMICDAEGPTAIAGVMGGEASEVADDTTDILLECAYFDPPRIRSTRKALKLSTEASYRFERGIDLDGMGEALRRAVQLIQATAGGEEPEAALDVYPKPRRARNVVLRLARVERLLGTPVPREEIERCLVRFGFVVAPKGDRFHVQVPGWRPDVGREEDLIEEIARFRGYDSFPVEIRPFRPSVVPEDPAEPLKARVRRVLTGCGLHEARSLSLTGAAAPDAWQVLNPLSQEESYLRQDLLSGLTRAAERNWAARERDVRLFEMGAVFGPKQGTRPEEQLRLAAVVTGARVPPHWSNAGKPPDYDQWDLKQLFEQAVSLVGAEGEVVDTASGWELRDASGAQRGWAGTLAADQPAWAAPLFGFELEVVVRDRGPVAYVPMPTTPPVERDVALVLPHGVVAREVEAVIREHAGEFLTDVRIFDEYRGGDIGRSVAWRLVFRATDRTLRDSEVDDALGTILRVLKERCGVERREA